MGGCLIFLAFVAKQKLPQFVQQGTAKHTHKPSDCVVWRNAHSVMMVKLFTSLCYYCPTELWLRQMHFNVMKDKQMECGFTVRRRHDPKISLHRPWCVWTFISRWSRRVRSTRQSCLDATTSQLRTSQNSSNSSQIWPNTRNWSWTVLVSA